MSLLRESTVNFLSVGNSTAIASGGIQCAGTITGTFGGLAYGSLQTAGFFNVAAVTYGLLDGSITGISVNNATAAVGQVLNVLTDQSSLFITGLGPSGSSFTAVAEGDVNPYGCTLVKSVGGWNVVGQSGAYLTSENAQLVAAGNSADSTRTLAYSVDGKIWFPVLSDPFAGPQGVASGVAYGAGMWVAAGTNNQSGSPSTCTLAYSINGLEWTPVTNDPFAGLGGVANAVAFNGLSDPSALWVAVGTNADNSKTVAKSTDGITWATLSTTDPFGSSSNGTGLGVAYGLGKWVIVGCDNITADWNVPRKTVATSLDGLTWSVGTCKFDDGGYGMGVACNGLTWVIGGRNQTDVNNTSTVTLCSGNPAASTWTAATGVDPFAGAGLYRCASVAWNGNTWMAVGVCNGNPPTMAYSGTPGQAWTKINDPPATPASPDFSTGGGGGRGVVWSAPLQLWVAVGSDGLSVDTNTILVSTDGFYWAYASNNPFKDNGRANGIAAATLKGISTFVPLPAGASSYQSQR